MEKSFEGLCIVVRVDWDPEGSSDTHKDFNKESIVHVDTSPEAARETMNANLKELKDLRGGKINCHFEEGALVSTKCGNLDTADYWKHAVHFEIRHAPNVCRAGKILNIRMW